MEYASKLNSTKYVCSCLQFPLAHSHNKAFVFPRIIVDFYRVPFY